jgi:hypothetical protein
VTRVQQLLNRLAEAEQPAVSRVCSKSLDLAHHGDDSCDYCGVRLDVAPRVPDSDDPAQLDVLLERRR